MITVNKIEELQTIKDMGSLDRIFDKAKRILVGGGKVSVQRVDSSGKAYVFEEFTNLDDLAVYKENVYKYLGD